jgi:Cu-Zn family superoxide dismutase
MSKGTKTISQEEMMLANRKVFTWCGAFVLSLVILASVVTQFAAAQEDDAEAVASLQGGPLAPEISGTVHFKPVEGGTIVTVELTGLPPYEEGDPPIGPHGFHIHANGDCEVGDPEDPFQAAEGHFNPDDSPHGDHAGDLPVLFSNEGSAQTSVFTNAFTVEEVTGRAVIVHKHPDDFRSQPSGDAGPRLACGVIEAATAAN